MVAGLAALASPPAVVRPTWAARSASFASERDTACRSAAPNEGRTEPSPAMSLAVPLGSSSARCVITGRVRSSPVGATVASGRGTTCDSAPRRSATSGSRRKSRIRAPSAKAGRPSACRNRASAGGRAAVAIRYDRVPLAGAFQIAPGTNCRATERSGNGPGSSARSPPSLARLSNQGPRTGANRPRLDGAGSRVGMPVLLQTMCSTAGLSRPTGSIRRTR